MPLLPNERRRMLEPRALGVSCNRWHERISQVRYIKSTTRTCFVYFGCRIRYHPEEEHVESLYQKSKD